MIIYRLEEWQIAWPKIQEMFYQEQGPEVASPENQARGMKLRLDEDLYEVLASENKVLVITASEQTAKEETLIGYLVALLLPHPSYYHLPAGHIVRRFVSPVQRKRGIGRNMLALAEVELAKRGIRYATLGEKSHLKYSKLPEGWKPLETTYIKWLEEM